MDTLNKYYRSYMYNVMLPITPHMYGIILNKYIKENAKILDVGIGNGYCIDKNAKIIKKKKLRIDGIDIDDDYLDICQEVIKNNKLEKNVTSRKQDLLKMNEDKKYDYVLFMESYPVIPLKTMIKMTKKSKKLLKPDGQLIFCHNLVDKKSNFVDWFKPRIKHIPFMGYVDFGRLSSHKDFDKFCELADLKIIKKKKIAGFRFSELISFLPNEIDYNCEQFLIICQ